MEFKKIDKRILLNETKQLLCPLYKKVGEKFVLFADVSNNDASYRNLLETLEKKFVGELFISLDNENIFKSFLRSSFETIVDSSYVSLQEKSLILHSQAENVMSDIFSNPRSGQLKKAKPLVDNIVNLTVKDPLSTKFLMDLSGKDYYTFAHSINVAVFSIGFLRSSGVLDKKVLYEVGIGGLLHDIGKTKVDRKILNKPGKLTNEEFAEIQKHPEYGVELVKDQMNEKSLDIVRHHHEKIGGGGYPLGLSGEDIPFYARVAALADVYDALTTNRSYSAAKEPLSALFIMKEKMLNHFENSLFTDFINMLGPKYSKDPDN